MTNGQITMVANLVPIIEASLNDPTPPKLESGRAAFVLLKHILGGAHTATSHARRGRPKKATVEVGAGV